eukprot:gene32265-32920_t
MAAYTWHGMFLPADGQPRRDHGELRDHGEAVVLALEAHAATDRALPVPQTECVSGPLTPRLTLVDRIIKAVVPHDGVKAVVLWNCGLGDDEARVVVSALCDHAGIKLISLADNPAITPAVLKEVQHAHLRHPGRVIVLNGLDVAAARGVLLSDDVGMGHVVGLNLAEVLPYFVLRNSRIGGDGLIGLCMLSQPARRMLEEAAALSAEERQRELGSPTEWGGERLHVRPRLAIWLVRLPRELVEKVLGFALTDLMKAVHKAVYVHREA